MLKLAATLILLAACQTVPVPPTAQEPGPVVVTKPSPAPPTTEPVPYAHPLLCGGRVWPDQWNTWLNEAITDFGGHMLAADIHVLCPRYTVMAEEQKRAFWVLLSSTIICEETGFDPNSRYWEGAMKHPVWSEGLWQLTYGDERGHKRCEISQAKGNILDPRTNLRCGVVIMDDQMAHEGVFADDSYWSTCRNSMDAWKTKNQWREWKGLLPFCTQP